MSRTGLKYSLNEEKFNLKTIVYLLILIDLFLFFYIPIMVLFLLIGYEGGMIIGLIIGLRGQARFKMSLLELRAIAGDKSLDDIERGHRLEQQVYHTLLEYGIWFDEQLEKQGFDFKKKRKNSEEVKKD